MECANDINAMIDAAKFADLVLLLTDGSYGFEMVRTLHNDQYLELAIQFCFQIYNTIFQSTTNNAHRSVYCLSQIQSVH